LSCLVAVADLIAGATPAFTYQSDTVSLEAAQSVQTMVKVRELGIHASIVPRLKF
jgi:hypothetical protein